MKKYLYFLSARVFALLMLLLPFGGLLAQNHIAITPAAIKPADLTTLNTKMQARLNDQQACMEVKRSIVNLVLWDCGIEDNDTVSVNLNGKWILHNFRLTNAKQEIAVTLAPGENQLVLLAENLGDLPDNTAAMAIKENGVEQEAVLNSNLFVSGTMRLVVKEGAPAGTVFAPCPKQTNVPNDAENRMVRANNDVAIPGFDFLYTGIRQTVSDPYRELDIQGCINVSDTSVVLFFWDSGIEDGDTISVNVNGKWVINNMRLTKAEQGVPVTLQPGSNYIMLYANNLGYIPNNTSGVGVKYKYGRQELGTLFSDMNTCGTFRVNCVTGAMAYAQNKPCVKTSSTVDRAANDPEMQQMNHAAINNYNNTNQPQNAGYNPPRHNSSTAVGVATAIGIGVAIIGASHHNSSGSGNSSSSSGSSGNTRRVPSGSNTPAPGRNAPPPVNY